MGMSAYMKDAVDHIPYAMKQLKELNRHKVFIGTFLVTGDESVETMSMILGVQENGATIKPVNGKYLTIPTKYAGRNKARDIPGLFYYVTKSKGQPALARVDDGQLHVYFLLAEQVVIPARPVMATTLAEISKLMGDLAADKVTEILLGQTTWQDVTNSMGELVANTLKANIAEWSTPPNAAITVNRKGFNNPLVDTGQLEKSISWVVI